MENVLTRGIKGARDVFVHYDVSFWLRSVLNKRWMCLCLCRSHVRDYSSWRVCLASRCQRLIGYWCICATASVSR